MIPEGTMRLAGRHAYIDGPAMTAASMESCRFAARRSPRGRFWSVVDVRKRLRRVRHPFHQSVHIKQRCSASQPA